MTSEFVYFLKLQKTIIPKTVPQYLLLFYLFKKRTLMLFFYLLRTSKILIDILDLTI
jgi:hypothetical protein